MSPPIIEGAGPLLSACDVVFCDVWGVVHDGVTAYASAVAALERFRTMGGTVILISNAPMPADAVAPVIDEKGVPRTAWDAIVTSGDLSLAHVAERGWKKIVKIEYDYDTSLFDRINARPADVAEAEGIVCVGMRDHLHETPEAYRALLQRALDRNLTFVCANPDLVVDVGGRIVYCAGTLAAMYEAMGGTVYWAGKPHPPIYDMARATAERLRGAPVDPARILAIGDSVRTDIAGATGYGIASVFVACGIHRSDVMTGSHIDQERLMQLFASGTETAAGALPVLAW
jgi:HAD superfamily hydrolase (TIGR01459 family)